MKQIVRAQYRAVIKAGTTEEQLKEAVEQSSKKMQEKLKHGEILTEGMFRDQFRILEKKEKTSCKMRKDCSFVS